MNTQFFKYAIEVDRTRSISQAAENLFMAQPNLSKAIREMEDTFGFSIFERNSKGVSPTAKGKEFLEYARSIVAQLEKMDGISKKESMQSFRIAIPHGSYISLGITQFISQLDSEKDIDISVRESDTASTISSVISGQLDLGVVKYAEEYERYFADYFVEKNLRNEQIWHYERVLIFSKDHPLANETEIKEDMLKDCIEINGDDDFVPYLPVGARPVRPDVSRKIVRIYERCAQLELLRDIAGSYMWIPKLSSELVAGHDLVMRECKAQGNKYKDVLIYPSDYTFTKLDRVFINKMYEAKNEVAFQKIK